MSFCTDEKLSITTGIFFRAACSLSHSNTSNRFFAIAQDEDGIAILAI
jgi:hypothetical protein